MTGSLDHGVSRWDWLLSVQVKLDPLSEIRNPKRGLAMTLHQGAGVRVLRSRTIRAEAAEPVPERELRPGDRRRGRAGGGRPGEERRGERRRRWCGAAHLAGERPLRRDQEHAGDGLQEHVVRLQYLIDAAQEHAAGLVEAHLSGDPADHGERPVLLRLEVAARLLVHDHEVHGEAVQAPELVRQEHLAQEVARLRVVQADQQDRQVTRDPVRPQPLLAPLVSCDHRRRGAQAGAREHDRRG
jgi:hypothetical protein